MQKRLSSSQVFCAGIICIRFVLAVPALCAADDEILGKAIAGIERNNSQIHTLRTTVEQLTISPNVERREIRQVTTGDGASGKVTVAPVSVDRFEITLKAGNVRSDQFSRVGDDWAFRGVTIFSHDMWTLYHSENEWAQIKRTDQLGGMFPIDPRQFGALDQRHDLLDQLRNVKVVDELSSESQHRDGTVGVLVEIEEGPDKGYRRIYHFDSSRNHLPTLVVSLHRDSTIANVVEIDYQEVLPETVWFFRTVTRRFFANAQVKDVTAKEWSQQTILRTVGEVRVNEEVSDDEFRFRFPEGTRVVNQAGAGRRVTEMENQP